MCVCWYELKAKVIDVIRKRGLMEEPVLASEFVFNIHGLDVSLSEEIFRIDYLLGFIFNPHIHEVPLVELVLMERNRDLHYTDMFVFFLFPSLFFKSF